MAQENFIKLFEKSFKENWDHLAMTDYVTKTDYTYKQVAEEVAKLHLLFEELNIKPGDHISLVGKNTPMWAMTFIAVMTYGAVIVPILQDFHPDDIQHVVNHSDSTFLFLSDNVWENIDESKVSDLRGIFSITEFRCLYQGPGESIQKVMKQLDALFAARYPNGFSKEDVKYIDKDNSEMVVLNYTSGSTGFSKGVMLNGTNFMGNIEFCFNHTKITSKTGDRKKILTFLPLAHVYGCTLDFLAQVTSGSHITFLNRVPSPKILLKAFEEIKPDVIFTVPLIVEKVYKSMVLPLLEKTSTQTALAIPTLNEKVYSEIRNKLYSAFGGRFIEIVLGGAAINKEVDEFLAKIKFPYTVGYGMTECAPLISYCSKDEHKIASAGILLSNMEAKIMSEDPANIAGELLVRGDNVMIGYYKNEEATQAAFDGEWLRTGDMATMDSENHIFLKGRCKNMILGASGQNIYPEAIEAKMVNLPFISECVVIARDAKLVALVYPDFAAMDESNVNREELDVIMEENRKTINKTLASYEAINKIVIFPNEFEKTAKKNIKRYLYEGL
ncbi:MAG: AMP-binding protein [Paludibacteraceae bacterium]|nr:AMP-binding protein [Paludibacteraceae bacterium]